jgi:hypothetical protein
MATTPTTGMAGQTHHRVSREWATACGRAANTSRPPSRSTATAGPAADEGMGSTTR